MSTTGEQAPPAYAQPAPSGSAYITSVVALALGVVLAVGVSVVFGLLGWGGELASQTAGAASGAAPLILDGVRQRRSRRRSRAGLRAVLRRYNKLWVASAFGFAVLLLNAVVGMLVWRIARWSIRLADGDPARFQAVYSLIGGAFTLPIVLTGTYLLAVAAGHRLGERTRRWILLGMAIYAVVTTGMLVLGGPSSEMQFSNGVLVAGLLFSTALMVGIALLGARRARKTQAAYYAQLYFKRLSPADQEAALLLLDETVVQSPPPPAPATPPAAVPSSAAGSLAPPPPGQR
jgi:hypothetical protein